MALTLQPTVLVHEALLKLMTGQPTSWENSRHFYNAAAQVMRQIVINHVRANATRKRGGDWARVRLEGVEPLVVAETADWEALDAALDQLKGMDERRHQVVMLRYFAGLTDEQIARSLDVSEKTVKRDWAAARAFLRATMSEQQS
jgi:RNA polymerase sigma factor (TIGR02999 family)